VNPWRWLWFRSLAFHLARAVGFARGRLSSGFIAFWVGFALLFGAATFRRAIQPCPGACAFRWEKLLNGLTLAFVVEAFAAYALMWLVVVNYHRRRRIVVPATVNHAGHEFAGFAAGLADAIGADLAALRELYTRKDQANPATGREIAPPIISFDGGEKLSLVEAVGEKSAVKLGGLEVPLRPLVASLERLLIPRRRLSTSLQRNGGRLILLAGVSGEEANWRVERDLAETAAPEAVALALTDAREELVYRIFTGMASVETSEWRAAKAFSAGLRAFRRTLSSAMDEQSNLREAEKHFFEARSLDRNYGRCSYNLGVVYRRQGDAAAAAAAFEQALRDDPRQVEAAYALSVIHQESKRWAQALEFADRAIAHAPAHAQAWNMKGWVWRPMHADPNARDAWASSLPFREQAVACAWRDLCRAAWSGQVAELDAARGEIAAPVRNLVAALADLGRWDRAERVMRRALRRCESASLHFENGKILQGRGRGAQALRAYQRALSFAPALADRARYYAYVAETQAALAANRFRRSDIATVFGPGFDPHRAALAAPSEVDAETLATLGRACRRMGRDDRVTALSYLSQTLDALKPRPSEADPARRRRLRQAARNYPSRPADAEVAEIIRWAKASFAIEIGTLDLRDQPPPRTLRRAERLLRVGVTRLQQTFPAERRLGFGYERLAEALRLRSKPAEALPFAEKAIALDPFRPEATRQRGAARFDLADYDRAERDLRRSFALAPSDEQTLQFLGYIPWWRGGALTRRADRSAELRQVIETFLRALDLTRDQKRLGWLHFWLGRFHGDLGDYDRAARHYVAARALDAFAVECRWYLGWIALEQELFDRAETHLRDALTEVSRQWRSDRRRAPTTGLKAWLKAPWGEAFSEPEAPRGYVVLYICLFMARIFAERGGDLARATRWLDFVGRRVALLGDPPSDRDKRPRFQERRREIMALREDYRGWVQHLDGKPREARRRLEASLRIRETPESLCRLARVHLAAGETDRAQACCAQARTVDARGVFESRIAGIEAEAGRAS